MKKAIKPGIFVRMLGAFSLRWGEKEINDNDNRMRKVWLLLAYLIYRRSVVTADEIAALLWDGDEDSGNPSGAIKTMFYRARTLLNRLGEDAGQTLILRCDGGYIWNPDIPMELDVQQVDALHNALQTAQDDEQRLALSRELLNLYGGDFLSKFSSENWVMPIFAWYHRLYLETVQDVLPQMAKRELWDEMHGLCTAALRIDPYNEEIYCCLMRAELALGQREAAASAYETMSTLLFNQFGVMPSETARELYRQAMHTGGPEYVANARELLREEEVPTGALFCEYDFFRMLYRAQARAIVRSGDMIHIALLSVSGSRGAKLSRRTLDYAMENLKKMALDNLRQGDVVTCCSVSQLLVMLPQANYESSCMICDRLVRSFARRYPHSQAQVSFNVQPLEPAEGSMPPR